MTGKHKWGVYDATERIWIGDDHGPKLYDEQWQAKVAARVFDAQLGNTPGQCREKEFIRQKLRLRDTVDIKMSALKAIKGLEDGSIL